MNNDELDKYRRVRAAQQQQAKKKSQPSTSPPSTVEQKQKNRQKPEHIVNRTVKKVSQAHGERQSSYTPAIHVGTRSRALPSSGSILLSILVPTVPGREDKLGGLLASLDQQTAEQPDVEVLVLRDARKMVIGDKRNRMIHIARGEYVVFIDDDDTIAPDYVTEIRSALVSRPDLVCFVVLVHGHGPPKKCYYHPTYENQNFSNAYRRKPNHIMVWRRELATTVEYPSIRVGEDTSWADAMADKAEKVVTIDRVLYTYWFDVYNNSTNW